MDGIQAFARRRGLFVIKDNAEAYGGSYKGKKTGTLANDTWGNSWRLT